MLKIRRSWGSLIFNMGIPILERWHPYKESAPWCQREFGCEYHTWDQEHHVHLISSIPDGSCSLQMLSNSLQCFKSPLILNAWGVTWIIMNCLLKLVRHARVVAWNIVNHLPRFLRCTWNGWLGTLGCQPNKLPASLVTPNKTHRSFAFVIGDFILYWISICIEYIF